MGILGFGADPVQPADLAAEGGNNVLWRIQHDRDNVHTLFPVGQTHAADDVRAIPVQQLIQLCNGRLVFHDDADESDSGFHKTDLLFVFCAAKKPHRFCDTATRPAGGGRFSLWRIFRLKNHFRRQELGCIVG